jgi:hypothetical protein
LESLDLAAKSPEGEGLTIDIGWFGSSSPRHALVHSSGLHGVEGFAGSAVQLRALDNLPAIRGECALVLVHILNPYGMAWLRRANENNVDLNRNFLMTGKYAGAPDAYAQLDSFLNPATLPHVDLYFLNAARLILRHGLPKLRQAIAGGQFEFPKGLFFGGHHREDGPRKYQEYLRSRLSGVERLLVVDVHTGLGRYGQDTLLVESARFEELRHRYGDRVAASDPASGPAYSVRGGLNEMFSDVFRGARLTFLTQEFGTYDSVRMLRALREENRWYHHGNASVDHWSRRKLKEAFYPQDSAWQNSVLQRGEEVLRKLWSEMEV